MFASFLLCYKLKRVKLLRKIVALLQTSISFNMVDRDFSDFLSRGHRCWTHQIVVTRVTDSTRKCNKENKQTLSTVDPPAGLALPG